MATTTQEKNTPTFPILLVNFIGSLGFSLVLPFLVILVTDFGGNEVVYGLVGATYSAFQLVGSPLLGRWSDRVGRRKVLLVSQAGTFLAWCLFLVALLAPMRVFSEVHSAGLGEFTLTLPLLLIVVARALDGITGGNVSVANAYLSDITPKSRKKVNFGKMGAAASLGSVVGPVLGGFAGGTALEEIVPVGIAIFISLVALGLIRFYLPGSSRASSPAALGTDCYEVSPWHSTQPVEKEATGFWATLRLPGVTYVVVMYFLFFVGFSLFFVSFPLYAIGQLDWDTPRIGLFFSVVSGVIVIVEGPVMSRLSGSIGVAFLSVTGCLILATGFFLLTYRADALVFAGGVCYGLGNSLLWPSFMSVVAGVGGSRYQGAVQGYAGSAGSLASILGLVAGGFVYQHLGETIFWVVAGWFVLLSLGSTYLAKLDRG